MLDQLLWLKVPLIGVQLEVVSVFQFTEFVNGCIVASLVLGAIATNLSLLYTTFLKSSVLPPSATWNKYLPSI